MPTAIKMPALSPTMEEGTLARWLVKVGDKVSSGDIMAEIETDKATMEFEAVDEGTIAAIEVPEGTEKVKVGTVIATLTGEDEDVAEAGDSGARAAAAAKQAKPAAAASPAPTPAPQPARAEPAEDRAQAPERASTGSGQQAGSSNGSGVDRVVASPLARRIAADKGVDLAAVKGSGPNGRIVKADVESAQPGTAAPKADAKPTATEAPAAKAPPAAQPAAAAPAASAKLSDAIPDFGIPFEDQKLSGMRKTIARRLTESKQQVPHIYLTVDVRLDALLKLRGELNGALASRGVKVSVNDLLIKALGVALTVVPKCNVAFAGDVLRQYRRADISVAVSVPNGLITPIVTDAAAKGVAQISTEMSGLAARAKEGKLQPNEYQGGTASLSNMGMMGITQFDAVINPPQGMILAVGAGEKRPYVVDDALAIATVMSATGSFDHRAIDGADGAQLMSAFRDLVEKPLGLLA